MEGEGVLYKEEQVGVDREDNPLADVDMGRWEVLDGVEGGVGEEEQDGSRGANVGAGEGDGEE